MDINEARDDTGVWDGSGISWTVDANNLRLAPDR